MESMKQDLRGETCPPSTSVANLQPTTKKTQDADPILAPCWATCTTWSQNRIGVPCLLSRGHFSCHGHMNYSQLGHRYFLYKPNGASDCCRHSMRNIDVFCVQRWNESINVDLAISLKCDNWLVCFYLVERILWKHISTCWSGGNCCEKYIPFKIIIIFYPGFRNFCGVIFLREFCNFVETKMLCLKLLR